MLPLLLASFAVAADEDVSQRPARWEVGLGLASARQHLDSATAVGRYNLLPGLAVEADAHYWLPGQSPATSLDLVLLDIAYQGDPNTRFQAPMDVAAWQLGARIDWGFLPRAAMGQVTGGPRLIAGIGARGIDHYVGVPTESGPEVSSNPAQTLQPVLETGFALDVWFSGRVGVVFRGLSVVWVADEPDYVQGDTDPATGQQQVLDAQVYTTFEPSLLVLFAF
ncbi:hypothetical protein LBMAG42_47590 [Deltaproteobacteria bacterium]|nr:hypothetical protein LBMAG42_47590 [Deltaproteobacteria bacterium]